MCAFFSVTWQPAASNQIEDFPNRPTRPDEDLNYMYSYAVLAGGEMILPPLVLFFMNENLHFLSTILFTIRSIANNDRHHGETGYARI